MSYNTPKQRRRERGVDAEAHLSPSGLGKAATNGQQYESPEWGEGDVKVRQLTFNGIVTRGNTSNALDAFCGPTRVYAKKGGGKRRKRGGESRSGLALSVVSSDKPRLKATTETYD
jgi:hypothetical protein